jgi:TldD protein
MLSKPLAIDVMNAALETGGDYVELYAEHTLSEEVTVDNGKADPPSLAEKYGVGIRILKGFSSVYGFTSDLSRRSLLELASSLARRFYGERAFSVTSLKKEPVKAISKVVVPALGVPIEEKVSLMKACHDIEKSTDEKIARTINCVSSIHKQIFIYKADGPVAHEYETERDSIKLVAEAVAFGETGPKTSIETAGSLSGWEWVTDQSDVKELARRAATMAVRKLSAKECPSGKCTVVVGPGIGGVLFHEACGHSLEASSTAKKQSVFSDAIGTQIASPLVSAYDDGAIPNAWGSNNIDDEGVPTRKTLLIDHGICKSFLVDTFNGRRLGMEPNGCSRRQSFKFEPTSRMSNTYIAAGESDPKDIIGSTELGIYVASFGGGSVSPINGEFNFSANEAYIIRNGRICEMVNGCTLIGSGKDVLMNIDMVGNDLKLESGGYCGSSSGSIPVSVGQPTIRIKNILVGGNGGELR